VPRNFSFFKTKNIEMLCKAMIDDEYDDTEQDVKEDRYDVLKDFILRNIVVGNVLDVGCGTGGSFKWYPITHAVEPSSYRFKEARKQGTKYYVKVKQAFCEALPYKDEYFDSVLALGVWEHLRSDFESLIEINRVLKFEGMFIMTLVTRSPAGRVYQLRSYFRTVEDFGFELIERRYIHVKEDWGFMGYAFRKTRDFDPNYLRKLQLVDLKHVKNFVQDRDRYLR